MSVHNALRDWWALGDGTPASGARLVREGWVDLGFRNPDQSQHWRGRIEDEVTAYLSGVDPTVVPVGVERAAAFKTGVLAFFGRIDRLDDRRGDLVVVDYKTGRRPLTEHDARTSLPMALYAAAVWRMFRRRCVRVELHHVPTGAVAAYEHSDDSLVRKVREAESIAADLRRADAVYAVDGTEAACFPPRVSPLCQWCDYRAHCREGQAAGPEKSSWAALEESTDDRVTDEAHFGGPAGLDEGGQPDGPAADRAGGALGD